MQKIPTKEEYESILVRDFVDDVKSNPDCFDQFSTNRQLIEALLKQKLQLHNQYDLAQLAYLLRALYEISEYAEQSGNDWLCLVWFIEDHVINDEDHYLKFVNMVTKANAIYSSVDITPLIHKLSLRAIRFQKQIIK